MPLLASSLSLQRKPPMRGGGCDAALLLCLLLLLLPGLAGRVQAQSVEREHALKAACVFNFCQFITWPADVFAAPSSPIVIGVYGNDAFSGVLEAMV
ncbi:MAG TPA: YfiR family protein, partial [Prosthecobacter sp.]